MRHSDGTPVSSSQMARLMHYPETERYESKTEYFGKPVIRQNIGKTERHRNAGKSTKRCVCGRVAECCKVKMGQRCQCGDKGC